MRPISSSRHPHTIEFTHRDIGAHSLGSVNLADNMVFDFPESQIVCVCETPLMYNMGFGVITKYYDD